MTAPSLFLNADERRTVGAGDVIYSEGETGEHMYGHSGSGKPSQGGTTAQHKAAGRKGGKATAAKR